MFPEVLQAVKNLKAAAELGCATVNAKKVTAAHALANALDQQHSVIAGMASRILDDCFPRDRYPNLDIEKLESVTQELCLNVGYGLSWYAGEKLAEDVGL
jgi:hypothetical protein